MVARHDLATDPDVGEGLATVRLGTAFFRRALGRVADSAFDAHSLLSGWSRRHLIAHVGYNARAIARLVTWAATGVETPMYASPQARHEEIERGATLRPDALRSLCEHAAIDLDVRWRDLPDPNWSTTVVTAQGRSVPASETLWMRTREVWLHAVDLDTGARVSEIPDAVLHRLLGDVVGAWSKRDELDGLRLVAARDDGPATGFGSNGNVHVEVSGPLPDLVAWATGRGTAYSELDLSWAGGAPRPAPRWI